MTHSVVLQDALRRSCGKRGCSMVGIKPQGMLLGTYLMLIGHVHPVCDTMCRSVWAIVRAALRPPGTHRGSRALHHQRCTACNSNHGFLAASRGA